MNPPSQPVTDLLHEIRTPLTNIRGYLEAMQDGVIPPDEASLALVHEEILRLERLLDGLSQQTPDLLFRREPVDLDGIAERLIRLYRPGARRRGVRLEAELGAGGLPIRASGDAMAQVMGNLLQNALRYTDAGGVIRVRTAGVGGRYRFVCLNTGPEIPREELPLLFCRFYRGAAARRESRGMGIGLAIVRDLVEAHGGRVGAESGGGWNTIWFEVPVS
ncbi:MAG TPA: HAMP domain-containing sensor histidine kinase [Symbiobacteriaceae bacterium]